MDQMESKVVAIKNKILAHLVTHEVENLVIKCPDENEVKAYDVYIGEEIVLSGISRGDLADIFRHAATKYAYYLCDSAALENTIERKSRIGEDAEGYYICPVCGTKVKKGLKHGWKEHAHFYSIDT